MKLNTQQCAWLKANQIRIRRPRRGITVFERKGVKSGYVKVVDDQVFFAFYSVAVRNSAGASYYVRPPREECLSLRKALARLLRAE